MHFPWFPLCSSSQKHMCLLMISSGATMSRIHPSDRGNGGDGARRRRAAATDQEVAAAVYTVWKRSSMGFQGTDGFSVYDAAGGLAFRVDNYARRPKAFAGELTLMDGHGTPLLSLRPQLLSLHDRWNCYRVAPGSEAGCDDSGGKSSAAPEQLFSMRKCSALQKSDEAEVYMSSPPPSGRGGCRRPQPAPSPSFRIEGCFSRRSCKISGSDGKEAARISRKKSAGATASTRPVALGDDVFSLVVRPGVDAVTVMAMVVVMDRISRRPYTPLACSSH